MLAFTTFLTWKSGTGSGPPEQALPVGPVPDSTGGTPGPAPHGAPTAATGPGAAGPGVPAEGSDRSGGQNASGAGLNGSGDGRDGPGSGQNGSDSGQNGSGDGRDGPGNGPDGSGDGKDGPGNGGQVPGGNGASDPPVTTEPPKPPPTDPPPVEPPVRVPERPAPPAEEARMVELRYADDRKRSVDIDYWRAEHDGGGDLNATATGLSTAGGAKLAIVRQGRGDWDTCGAERDDWTGEVSYSVLARGTYLCARSSAGRSAYLRIEALPTATYQAITFYGFTWDDPG